MWRLVSLLLPVVAVHAWRYNHEDYAFFLIEFLKKSVVTVGAVVAVVVIFFLAKIYQYKQEQTKVERDLAREQEEIREEARKAQIEAERAGKKAMEEKAAREKAEEDLKNARRREEILKAKPTLTVTTNELGWGWLNGTYAKAEESEWDEGMPCWKQVTRNSITGITALFGFGQHYYTLKSKNGSWCFEPQNAPSYPSKYMQGKHHDAMPYSESCKFDMDILVK